MNFNSPEELEKEGFIGFKTMQDLFFDSSILPSIKGVYLILNLNKHKHSFLPKGSGGYFKGRNPNVNDEVLNANWVENTIVLYIGKAGSHGGKANLKTRLKQYFGFGQGKNIGHWGGRLIWQLAHSNQLVVCWKTLANDDPKSIETKMIGDFVNQFGCRPFANLVG